RARMSATSGPMVPDSTGKSTVFPSSRVRTAFLLVLIVLSCVYMGAAAAFGKRSPPVPGRRSTRAQQRDNFGGSRTCLRLWLATSAEDFPQRVIVQQQQGLECLQPLAVQRLPVSLEEFLQHQVVFQQSAPAAPLQPVEFQGTQVPRLVLYRLTLYRFGPCRFEGSRLYRPLHHE